MGTQKKFFPQIIFQNLKYDKMSAIPGYQTTFEELKAGSGAKVEKGRTVTVHATGVVKETLVNKRSRPKTIYLSRWSRRSYYRMGSRASRDAVRWRKKTDNSC